MSLATRVRSLVAALAPISPPTSHRRSLRKASKLLDQQMWCWGQDIERKEGNLLLQFGFRKERPPANVTGSTAYIFTPFAGCQLVLWGFGLFFGLKSSGSIFLKRYGFDPVWSPVPTLPDAIWTPDRLPAFQHAKTVREQLLTSRLTVKAALWFAGYEQWVLDSIGVEYRQVCLNQWRKKKAVSATEVPAEWRALAEGFASGQERRRM